MNFYTIQIDQKLFRELNKSRSVNKFFGITYVGECVRLISEYHEADPRPSQKGWENFYGTIQGFEGRAPIGPDLSAIGSKPLTQFGFGHEKVEFKRDAWITAHLMNS